MTFNLYVGKNVNGRYETIGEEANEREIAKTTTTTNFKHVMDIKCHSHDTSACKINHAISYSQQKITFVWFYYSYRYDMLPKKCSD